MTPKVTFIMPSIRDNDVCQRAVEAIQRQTIPDIEILFMNGKPDRCKRSLDFLAEDSRVTVVDNFTKYSPQGSCLEQGVRLANAPIVCLQYDDDEALPYKAELFHRFFIESPYDIIHTAWFMQGKEGLTLAHSDPYDTALMEERGNYIPLNATGIRVEAFNEFKIKKDGYRHIWDYITLMNAGRAGLRFRYLSIPTEISYYVGDNMHSNLNGLDEKLTEYERFRKETGNPKMADPKYRFWVKEYEWLSGEKRCQ